MDISHYLYVYDIAQHFMRYFNAVQNDGKSVDYSGTKKHLLPDGTPWIFPSLPEMIEEHSVYLKYYTPKLGDIVLDAGGYSGLTARYFSQLVGPTGKVIVLEPDKFNFKCLKENLASYKNVIPHQLALWDQIGELVFCHHGNQGSSLKIVKDQQSDREMVKTTTFNELEGLYGKFNFCKIDIEGAEEWFWNEILKRKCAVELHSHDSIITRLQCSDILIEKDHSERYLFTQMEMQP